MQKISFKKFIPGIAWFFVILILICLPGKDVPEADWLAVIPNLDKLVHFGIFGVLGVLFCCPFYGSDFSSKARKNYFIKIAMAVCIYGIITELIQKFYVPSRDFDLLDWAADSLGALIAYLFSRKKFAEKVMKSSNQLSVVKFISAAICLAAVFGLMMLPVKKIPFKTLLNQLAVDKWVHVGAFAALVFLIIYPYYKDSVKPKDRLNFFIKVAVAVSLFGLLTEVLQKYFVKGRSFDLWDWAADMLGMMIGFWSAAEFTRLHNVKM